MRTARGETKHSISPTFQGVKEAKERATPVFLRHGTAGQGIDLQFVARRWKTIFETRPCIEVQIRGRDL